MVTNSGEQSPDASIIVRFGRGAPGGQGVASSNLASPLNAAASVAYRSLQEAIIPQSFASASRGGEDLFQARFVQPSPRGPPATRAASQPNLPLPKASLYCKTSWSSGRTAILANVVDLQLPTLMETALRWPGVLLQQLPLTTGVRNVHVFVSSRIRNILIGVPVSKTRQPTRITKEIQHHETVRVGHIVSTAAITRKGTVPISCRNLVKVL